jgi:hypothetical protein
MPLIGTFGAGSKGGYGRGGKKLYALSYLVIAGGGTGRGPDRGGGGGAGGYRTNFSGDPLAGDVLEVEAGTYPVTVGGPGTVSSMVYSPASDTISASAGSQGAGGSGGGGFSGNDPGRLGRAGNIGGYSPPEGNPGGDAQPGSGNPYAAGGGGGAGATGGALIQVALMEALEEQDNQAVLQVHQSLEQAVAVADVINQEVEEMVVLEEERPQMGLDQLTLEAVEAELI